MRAKRIKEWLYLITGPAILILGVAACVYCNRTFNMPLATIWKLSFGIGGLFVWWMIEGAREPEHKEKTTLREVVSLAVLIMFIVGYFIGLILYRFFVAEEVSFGVFMRYSIIAALVVGLAASTLLFIPKKEKPVDGKSIGGSLQDNEPTYADMEFARAYAENKAMCDRIAAEGTKFLEQERLADQKRGDSEPAGIDST